MAKSGDMPVWLTQCCVVILVGLVRMGKTHLEHQVIKYRPYQTRNSTTTFDPYADYDPQQGITTALILGIGFLLIIFYIVFKSGWRKFRKKWCYRIAKNHDEKMESPTDDIESNLFDEEKGGEQHVTIPTITLIPERATLTYKTEEPLPASNLKKLNSLGCTNSVPNHIRSYLSTCQNGSTTAVSVHPVESHTVIVSEKPATITNKSKTRTYSRSNSSPDKSPSKQALQPLLPPHANQALRTALWVKAVTNEMTSLDENSDAHIMASFDSDRTQSISGDSRVVRAEINHKPSPSSSRHELVSLTKLGVGNSNHNQQRLPSDNISIELTTTEV